MAGGLAALLDDVAALVKLTAASTDDVAAAAGRASAKAAGVVVDDAAVVPQYVRGIEPKREFPIVWKIAKGSLLNKLIILVIILILDWLLPASLTPLLMLGGLYLSFEGAEKVLEMFGLGHHAEEDDKPAVVQGEEAEKKVVSGAVRTDFILSAEIMVISMNSIAADAGFGLKAITLVVVAVLITLLVYGAVALLVKADDFGLRLMEKDSAGAQKFGRGLVDAMPKVMKVISVVGTFAMLWVGGHILLAGFDTLGWHWPYGLVHSIEHWFEHFVSGWFGSVVLWLVETICSMIFGFIFGTVIALVVMNLPKKKKAAH
ncbi:DUF808 domain-containing protein [Rothia aerolata]|uniref:ABC transporter n=1 Tax=Rothia aerolata TaxID=1812262 RepID=A0A917ITU2_9MICC|nr:DUF808 domain-containing protein [Rothia aerolata]GGH62523.1 ABC transporter [Rothia aerolata]